MFNLLGISVGIIDSSETKRKIFMICATYAFKKNQSIFSQIHLFHLFYMDKYFILIYSARFHVSGLPLGKHVNGLQMQSHGF